MHDTNNRFIFHSRPGTFATKSRRGQSGMSCGKKQYYEIQFNVPSNVYPERKRYGS